MRDLPNPRLIEAFEAVARHRSFTHAAQELNVLQPAISRKIAELEADLGSRLFHRTKPRLTLTEDGEFLFATASAGMMRIRDAAIQIRARRPADVLVVNTSIGFASCYLMPRLAAFGATSPEIELELITRDQNRTYDPGQCDVVVVFGEADEAAPGHRTIFNETLVAITGPDHPAAGADLSPDDLVGERLLHLSDRAHAQDWTRFFDGMGLTVPDPARADRFTSFMVYLQAALNGEGIALGWDHLLTDLVNGGRLTIVSDRRVTSARGYQCRLTASGAAKPAARVFRDWLCETARHQPSLPA